MENNDNEPKSQSISESKEDVFSNKNAIIVFLTILLIFSFLGINVIKNIGDLLQHIVNTIFFFIRPLLSNVTFLTGSAIDSTGDLVADASKTGIDIANGTVDSVGKLLIKASGHELAGKDIDQTINRSTIKLPPTPKPDSTTNPIQNPISTTKTNWCLIDEYEGKRNCVEIGESQKCMSGQVFPEQKMCLNPTLTN
jgi:hypothetical protein